MFGLHRFQTLIIRHFQAAFNSLGRLWRFRGASLMTLLVVAFALMLPVGLHLVLKNMHILTDEFNHTFQMTLFLQADASTDEANGLYKKIQNHLDVEKIEWITKSMALEEFETQTNLTDLTTLLGDNPLPEVFVITPNADLTVDEVKSLYQTFSTERIVDSAFFDFEWLDRAQSIILVATRFFIVLIAFVAAGIFLILLNTIRLTVHQQRDEITVTRLVGATNAFIRRPFLYSGFWVGCISATLCWLFITMLVVWLGTALHETLVAFGFNQAIVGLSFNEFGWLLAASVLVSVSSSWVAVSQHLGEATRVTSL